MERTRNIPVALWVGALLAALTLAAYWPVLSQGFTSYDDNEYVTENAQVQAGLSWDGVVWAFRSGEAANWHPVTWLSHMVDVQLFGQHATGHHLSSVLLHIANCLLLFLLLKRLTRRLWPSAFVAGLFALHPLHVESVAWVAERKDVLSSFFFLLTLLAYTAYVHGRPSSQFKVQSSGFEVQGSKSKTQGSASSILHPPPSFCYVLALLLYALGLMSKPMVVTLPFVLLLLDYWPLHRFESASRLQSAAPTLRQTVRGRSRFKVQSSGLLPLLYEKLPFFALAAASSAVTLVVQSRGGTVSALGDYSLSNRLSDAVVAYLKYLGKAVWPADLAIYYPHPSLNPAGQWPGWQVGMAVLVLVGISLLAFLRRKQDGWLACGWFWFLGMLVPVSGLVQAGSQAMADRYSYLPLIGVFLCVAYGVDAWLAARRVDGRLAVLTGLVLLLACVGLTRRQVNYWKDDTTLFAHALAVNERNGPALQALGWECARESKYGMGLAYCRAAVKADPSFWAAWHTLGDIDMLLGKPRDALQNYQTALHWNPNSAQTWLKLGNAQSSLENLPEAIQDYQAALRQKPGLAAAHTSLGVAWLSLGKKQDALKEFAEALRLNPDSPERHYNLGTTLTDTGKLAEGEAQLAEAVRLKPDYLEARTAWAGVLALEGRTAAAATQVQEAAQRCPGNAQGRLKLGSALLTAGLTNDANAAFADARRLEPNLARLLLAAGETCVARGELDAAMVRFQAVLWVEPGSVEAHQRLGLLLASRGKLEAAVPHLREAVRLAPGAETHYSLALVLGMQGSLKEAVTNYARVIEQQPDSAPALNDLAWIKATAPNPDLRDGAAAVRLAQRACELAGRPNARFLGTLAAAYAEAGRFPEAIATAEKARELTLAAGDKSLAEAAGARLELYRNHQPYRQ